MDEKQWVVVNIGCIECGVTSAIVGTYDDKAEADRVAGDLDDKLSWRQGGQNSFEVFALPPIGEVSAEYQAALQSPDGKDARSGIDELFEEILPNESPDDRRDWEKY